MDSENPKDEKDKAEVLWPMTTAEDGDDSISEWERSGARACSHRSPKALVKESIERIEERGQDAKGMIIQARQLLTDKSLRELDQGITDLKNWHDKQTEDDHESLGGESQDSGDTRSAIESTPNVASTVVDETKSLREELRAARARHDRVESKLNVVNEQKKTQQTLLESSRAHHKAFETEKEAQLRMKQQQIDQLQQDKAELKQKVRSLQQDKAELKREVRNLQQDKVQK